jgi:hypothetical protein
MRVRIRRSGENDPILALVARIQRAAQMSALSRGYLAVLLLAVGLVFAGVLLDHALTLQRPGRAVFLASFLIACSAGIVAATLFPLVARLNALFVARAIERTVPELKDSLMSYLQCRSDPRVPAEMKLLLQHKAYGYVKSVDPRLVAHRDRSARLGWALLAAVTAFVLYAALSPKSVAVSLERLFAPTAPILPPTRTRITAVEPGDAYVLRGGTLFVRAQIKGARPEHASVLWSGSTFSNRRVLLSQEEDSRLSGPGAPRRGGGQGWWTGELPGVLEDGSYYVVAGDSRSEQYAIVALPRPAVTAVTGRIVPPPYTGLPVLALTDGNMDVISGSNVLLKATVNLPPREGYMQLASGGRIWLKPAGLEAEGYTLTTAFTVTRSDSYRVFFKTQEYPDGSSFENSAPVTYQITCRDDEAPNVQLHNPPDGVRMAPDAVALVEYDARDDFGVTALALRYEIDRLQTGRVPLLADGSGRFVEGELKWNLAELAVREGDVVEYFIEAADNWPLGPHVAESERRRILIGAGPTGDAGKSAGQPAQPGEGGQPQQKPSEGDQKTAGQGPSEKAPQSQAVRQKPDKGQPEPSDREQAEKIARALRLLERREREAEGSTGSMRPTEGQPTGQPDAGARAGAKDAGEREPGTASAAPQTGGARSEKAAETGGSEAQGAGAGCPCTGGASASGGDGGGTASAGSGTSGGAQSAGGSQGGAGGEGAAAGAGMQDGASAGAAAGAGTQNGTEGGGGSPGRGTGDSGAGAQGRGSTAAGAQGGMGGGNGLGRGGRRGGAGSVGGGGSYEAVAGGVGREGSLSGSELRRALTDVERRITDGTLPEEMLDDLGMNRKQLEEFLRRYRQQLGEPKPAEEGPSVESEGGAVVGGVIEGGAEPAEDVTVESGAPARTQKDSLRSRFEDESGRIGPRYREAVNAYYRRLSEER